MNFSICNSHDGYIVMAEVEDRIWKPLRNFGDRQGDAIMFRDYDCPKLNDSQIKILVREYSVDKRYKRLSGRKFVKTNQDE